jgi:phosphoribosylformimino-5-aminoimidazole carboxamide ribotide isomerase
MIIYPAIDILHGRGVRLRQGRREDVTDYGDPVDMAARFAGQGARWLHVVDLEAAFEGKSGQGRLIQRMIAAFGGPVQLGGGIRSLADIRLRLEEWGVARCILGTAAVTNPGLVEKACALYPQKIACGIDARDGLVALRGWVERTDVTASALARDMALAGVAAIIYTDIARDGMLTGPNVAATARLAKDTPVPVIASGGIAALPDLRALRQAGCGGAIVGKALYTGAFTLPQALEVEVEEEGGIDRGGHPKNPL